MDMLAGALSWRTFHFMTKIRCFFASLMLCRKNSKYWKKECWFDCFGETHLWWIHVWAVSFRYNSFDL